MLILTSYRHYYLNIIESGFIHKIWVISVCGLHQSFRDAKVYGLKLFEVICSSAVGDAAMSSVHQEQRLSVCFQWD